MMKRISLFVLATLTAAGALAMPVNAQACKGIQYGYVMKGACCNIEEILKQLHNCWPSMHLECTDIPNTECGPETPAAPETPEVPVKPETPVTPETPKTPEVPVKPEVPVTPEAPETPETPITPETPEAPETPVTPETPEAPAESEEGSTNTSYADQVAALVNKERTKNGLTPLTLDRSISAAAQTRTKEIEISFSHTRPNGSSFSTVLDQAGISYRGAGENIAWGQRSPEEVMNGWMNSSGHRANILNSRYTKIGVGCYQNVKGTIYWVQLFTY